MGYELVVFRRSRYRQLPSFLRYYYKVFFIKNQAFFIKLFKIVKSISYVELVCWLTVLIFTPWLFSCVKIPPLDTSSPLEN